jgi:hypothetical protein
MHNTNQSVVTMCSLSDASSLAAALCTQVHASEVTVLRRNVTEASPIKR